MNSRPPAATPSSYLRLGYGIALQRTCAAIVSARVSMAALGEDSAKYVVLLVAASLASAWLIVHRIGLLPLHPFGEFVVPDLALIQNLIRSSRIEFAKLIVNCTDSSAWQPPLPLALAVAAIAAVLLAGSAFCGLTPAATRYRRFTAVRTFRRFRAV